LGVLVEGNRLRGLQRWRQIIAGAQREYVKVPNLIRIHSQDAQPLARVKVLEEEIELARLAGRCREYIHNNNFLGGTLFQLLYVLPNIYAGDAADNVHLAGH